jgi:uncharacterized protein YlzI (FlbEa/FlbD family)
MKTAMQELIEFIESTNNTPHVNLTIMDKAKKLLEKEKEQIINAWIATDNKLQRLAAEQYYNETYNQN